MLRLQAKPGNNIVVDALVDLRRRELEEHTPRDPNVVYVIDLVRCPLKRQFELRYPQLAYASLVEPRLLLGDIVHWGVEAMLKAAFGAQARVEREGLERGRVVEVDGRSVEVRGRIDAIVTLIEGGDVIEYGVEVKYTANGQNAPYEHHVEQAAVYNWLYGLPATILLYVTPDGLREFIVDKAVDDGWVIARARETLEASRAPRYDWECRYCPFRGVCPRRHT